MKAKKGVVEFLNKVLTNELTAINQYFLHAEMCGNWGYTLLHNEMRKHAIDEMKHAEQIIEHVLFLDGFPNLQRLGTLKIGETVPEQLKSDLGLEHAAVKLLTEAVEHCVKVGDFNTRSKLEAILTSEEEHIDWIETQLETMKQVGVEIYLSQHMHVE